MRERRTHDRHRVCFPLKLDTNAKPDRLGMCRNGSASGLLFGTASVYSVGDEITLTFRIAVGDRMRSARARVVRLSKDRAHSDAWCNKLVAVEFEKPQPELVPFFASEAPRHAKFFAG